MYTLEEFHATVLKVVKENKVFSDLMDVEYSRGKLIENVFLFEFSINDAYLDKRGCSCCNWSDDKEIIIPSDFKGNLELTIAIYIKYILLMNFESRINSISTEKAWIQMTLDEINTIEHRIH